MDFRDILLHLSLIAGVGPALVKKIISAFGNQALQDLYSSSIGDFIDRIGISHQAATMLYKGLRDTDILMQEKELLAVHGSDYCTILDPEYPSFLAEIYLPPTVLYYEGSKLDNRDQCLAFVGSRQGNIYGQRVINLFVPPLVANGWTIVSGGARGIDAMAHKATLDAGGKTVVVLGSGLLHPYPESNKRLFNDVVQKGGTLISSFSLSMRAVAGNFPARNRIIAGLSRGCVVVQAAESSGAAITAAFALQQGREVFAVPGPIDDPLSVGCHALIQEGARLITRADDIFQEFGQVISANNYPTLGNSEQKVSNDNFATLCLKDKILYLCIEPKSLDQLVDLTGGILSEVQNMLVDMQLDCKVEQNNVGFWYRCT